MTSDPKYPANDGPPGSGPHPGEPAAAQANDIADVPPAGRSAAEHAGPEASGRIVGLEIVKLEGQIKDLTDRLLRAHAEMDNMRKRAERERDETAKFAITKFARDIVGVSDNFQRAIAAVPAGAVADDPALKTLFDGVSITERELVNVLERHGVKRIDPSGDLFNPHKHQAMMEVDNPEVASGTILQVFQPGYVIDDRVIRPAMVVVAKGGAKAGKVSEAKAPDGEGGNGNDQF